MKMRRNDRYRTQLRTYGKVRSFSQSEVTRAILEYRREEKAGAFFRNIADEWWARHSDTIEYNTAKQYKPALREIIEHFDDMRISDIKSKDIDLFIRGVAARGFAQKTVKTRLLVLNLIFKYAVINQYVDLNPCQYIAVPKNLRKEKRPFPQQSDIETVQRSLNCTFGLFAYTILYTGLRRGEALALTWRDIDFDNKILHVTKSVYYVGNVPHLKTPKTEAGNRDVILPDCLAAVLSGRKAAVKAKETGLVFPDQNGDLLHDGHFTRLWDKYRSETGLSITPHQLRHAYATILYEAGVEVKDAQELMGHSTVQVTQDIYTHISEAQKKRTAEKINSFVAALPLSTVEARKCKFD